LNILYIADPNSIHDIKWMSFFSEKHQCFLLQRAYHAKIYPNFDSDNFCSIYNIKVLGSIKDFSLRNFLSTISQYRLLKKIIKENKIDLIHVMYAEPNALWAYFRNSLHVPIILTTRGTDVLKTIPEFYNNKGLLNNLVAYCYRKAFLKTDTITCTSSKQQASILKMTNAKAKEISIIRTGVDVDLILSDHSAKKRAELMGKKYVFFPRAMRPLYHHELAIEAISLLPSELRKAYSFVFVDKNSSDKAYTEEIGQKMSKCETSFVWLENLDQPTLFETYKNAVLCVMTPKSDGTPVSAIEAMICKIPLILPDLDYDRDIFSEGISFFEQNSAASLSNLMTKHLEGNLKPDLEKAFNNALNLADRKREMNKLGEIYRRYAN
jgi:glycosyltransferase involved in cell wall biosynthesis